MRSSLIDLDERRESWRPQPAESESICSKATSPRPDHHLQKNSGMEPPSPQLHTNSSAPATRRLIKAMHLFMTELIKQRKRWSPLWKHISPRGNCLWSRSPRAVSGHRFWIFVTYEETGSCSAFKKIKTSVLRGRSDGSGHSSGCIWSCLNWSHNYMYRSLTAGWTEIHFQVFCFAFLSSGICGVCCSLHCWFTSFNIIWQLQRKEMTLWAKLAVINGHNST